MSVENTEFEMSPIDSLSTRERLAYANELLTFSNTGAAKLIREEIEWFAKANEAIALSKISKCDTKDAMIDRLDNLMRAKGMNKLALLLADKFNPDTVKLTIESITEELKEELEREEEEKNGIEDKENITES